MTTDISITTGAAADPATVTEYGDALPELVRALNHITRHHEAMEFPADADRLLRNLALAATRLPQLLEQVTAWLDTEQAAGGISVPAGEYAGNPALATAAVQVNLIAAAANASALRETLDAAASVTTGMASAREGDENGGRDRC